MYFLFAALRTIIAGIVFKRRSAPSLMVCSSHNDGVFLLVIWLSGLFTSDCALRATFITLTVSVVRKGVNSFLAWCPCGGRCGQDSGKHYDIRSVFPW